MRPRARVFSMIRFLLLCLVTLASGAAAEPLTERYPAGSFADRSTAEAARDAASAEIKRLDAEEARGTAECYQRVLVNDCIASLHKRNELARREARRIQVEAKDVIRKLDAEEAARRKAERERQNAEEAQARARREQEAATSAKPVAEPKSERISAEQAAANRAASEKRAAEVKAKQAEAAERAAQADQKRAAYEAKQAAAAQRAEESKRRQADAQRKRAERAEQRKKAEAEREAAIRRAEEAGRK